MREWRYGSSILALDTTWRCVVIFTPWGKIAGTHCRGGWVGPRAGMDGVKNRNILPLLGFELPAVQPAPRRYTPTELVRLILKKKLISRKYLLTLKYIVLGPKFFRQLEMTYRMPSGLYAV
jgi:hypothetical protein